jgi:hypothetical protein
VSEEYYTVVQDLKFVKIDESGKAETDNKGNVILYETLADLGFITRFIHDNELFEVVDCE